MRRVSGRSLAPIPRAWPRRGRWPRHGAGGGPAERVPAPYPRALRGRIAALNRLLRHDARDPIVRDVVRQRAADACEYCLMPTTGKFEIEHIIPKQRWNDYLAGTYPGLRRA